MLMRSLRKILFKLRKQTAAVLTEDKNVVQIWCPNLGRWELSMIKEKRNKKRKKKKKKKQNIKDYVPHQGPSKSFLPLHHQLTSLHSSRL